MKQDKIWTKDFVFLLLSNFFVSLNFYLLMTTMAVFAIRQYQASESTAGLAASIFIIGALFARLFAGKFIDVIGRKKMMYSGLILFFIGSLAYLFATNIGFLMFFRFIHGMGFGFTSTVLSTVIMTTLPPSKRGEGIGYFSLSNAAGTAIGPFLALYLTSHFTYSTMFFYCILFSIIAFGSAVFVTIKEIDLSPEQKIDIKRSLRFKDFFDIDALPISLLMFICGISYSGVVSFINSYALELNLTKAASFFFVVYAIFLFIGRPVAGKIFDKKGENIVVYPCFSFFAIGLLLMTWAINGFMLLLAGACLALGYGNIMSCMQTVIGKVCSPQRLGLAISTYFICLDAGMGIGPYILGLIVEKVGYQWMYGILAIAILVLIPAYYFVHGKKAGKVKKSNLVRSVHE